MDILSELAPNLVPDAEHHFLTNAPECYDGFGTTTVAVLPYTLRNGRDPVRIVHIPDAALANDWQANRYWSGMKCFEALESLEIWIPLWKKIEQPAPVD